MVAAAPPQVGFWRTCWGLITGTTAICFKYRVTGLASEAAFFALVSLPPLVLGVIGAIGLIANRLPPETLDRLTDRVTEAASGVLQPDVVESIVVPLMNSVINGGGFPITFVGLAIMLWSGSRWLNVYVDTITIMYGLDGRRHFLKTRALSFTLYLLVLLFSIILLPLLAVGPDLLGRLLPNWDGFISAAYYPAVVGVSILLLTTLYHVAVPVWTPWRRDLPGAGLALGIWLLGSFVLRFYLGATVSSTSAYGSLSAAIAVLFWLYVTAIAVLIGAGLNAVVDRTWPIVITELAREEQSIEAAHAAAEDADTELALVAARRARLRLPGWANGFKNKPGSETGVDDLPPGESAPPVPPKPPVADEADESAAADASAASVAEASLPPEDAGEQENPVRQRASRS